MLTKNKKIIPLLGCVFLGILLLYLLSAFPFAALLSLETGGGVPYFSLLARFLRVLLGAAFCWVIRQRSQETLLSVSLNWQRLEWILLGLGLASVLLNLFHWGDHFYLTISYAAGVLPAGEANFWLVMFWEQVVSIDFLWCLLLGFAILLLPVSSKHKA